MEEILQFLTETPTFYFATVDGDKPRVRPFGLVLGHEGKLYLGIGKHKQSYKQLQANPNVEISTTNVKGEWIRIKGTVVFDDNETVINKAFEKFPNLAKMYNEKTGQTLGFVYLENGDAEIADFAGNFKKISF